MARSPYLKVWIVTGGLFVLACAIYWYTSRNASLPGPVERSFVQALEARDWSRTYDLAVKEQLGMSGISKKKFIRFMAVLTEELPDEYFKDVRMEEVEGKTSDHSRGFHGVLLTFPHAPMDNGAPVQQLLHAMRAREGWLVAINELPLRFARFDGEGDRRARWRRLSKAMHQAEVHEYSITLNGPVYKRERLDAFLAGEIEEREISVR